MLPGITLIPYGDLEALKAAITPKTAGFLVEPIQGEAGIIHSSRRVFKSNISAL